MHGSILDLTTWTALVSTVLVPLLTAIVQQPHWSKRLRTVVGVVVSGAAAIVTELVTNPSLLTHEVTIPLVIGAITATVAAYRGLWSQAGVTPAIELATTSKTPAGH